MNPRIFSVAIEVVTVAFEVFIISMYFRAFLQKKSVKRIYCGTIYVVSFLSLVMVSVFFSNALLLITVTALFMFFISTLYEGPLRVKIPYIILFCAFIALVDFLTGVIIGFLKGLLVTEVPTVMEDRVLGVVISKLLVFLLVKVQYFRKRETAGLLSFVNSFLLSILPISSVIVTFELLTFWSNYKMFSARSFGFVLVGIVCLLVSNVAVFVLFEQNMAAQRQQERLKMMEQEIANQTEYYKDLVVRQKEIRQIQHDMKNCLSSIAYYLDQQDVEHAKQYIEEVNQKTFSLKNQVNTGYHALDIALWGKIGMAEEEQIQFRYTATLLHDLQVNEVDLCIILANAIDNAIEACKQIPDVKKRWINLSLKWDKRHISILIRNSVHKKVPILKDNVIRTTKEDVRLHGFGIQSIKNMTSRYDGDLVLKCSDDEFIMSVLLRNIESLT